MTIEQLELLETLSHVICSRTTVADKEAIRAVLALLDRQAKALLRIAAGMGNLSLEQMGPAGVSGPNDGKQRAVFLEEFVRIARKALEGQP